MYTCSGKYLANATIISLLNTTFNWKPEVPSKYSDKVEYPKTRNLGGNNPNPIKSNQPKTEDGYPDVQHLLNRFIVGKPKIDNLMVITQKS